MGDGIRILKYLVENVLPYTVSMIPFFSFLFSNFCALFSFRFFAGAVLPDFFPRFLSFDMMFYFSLNSNNSDIDGIWEAWERKRREF